MSSNTSLPSRERCACCKRYSPVGFSVPNAIWDLVVANEFYHSILCVSCFADMGDERLVEWDTEIEFYPVSLATHARLALGLNILPEHRAGRSTSAGSSG